MFKHNAFFAAALPAESYMFKHNAFFAY